MPELAEFHPIVVHFVVALLFVGVPLRWLALTGKVRWAGPAAATLLLAGAAAGFVAVRSGDAAHGPAERIPGARPAVVEHEELGERAGRIFLAVAALELLALGLRKKRYGRAFLFGSAALGAFGLAVLYEAGEHGGELVYAYAGGVGTRSGEPEDVGRLLRAGLYHQAMLDREAGRAAAAARLIEEMALRWPDDAEVGILLAESRLLDGGDPEAALAALESAGPGAAGSLRLRAGMLRADILEAQGQSEQARALLNSLAAEFPGSARLRQRLER